MPGIEEATVAFAMAVVKSAVRVWMKDNTLAADASTSAIDILGRRASDYFQRAKTDRTFAQIAETVAKKAIPLIEREYRGLPDNEKQAAIDAVADTFEAVGLDDDDLYQSDLNAGYLEKHLRTNSRIPNTALLSESATELYNMLLREACEYLVQVVKSLPAFQPGVLTEILRRETQIRNSLQDLLDRLPQPDRHDRQYDPSVTYRRQVINMLDQMELFGASLSESSRRYPLSLAFIGLSVMPDSSRQSTPESRGIGILGQVEHLSSQRQSQKIGIEAALQSTPRLFIRGEAGSGKTTILKWIAVRLAARDLPAELAGWNQHIPFYIPLRRYSDSDFPKHAELVNTVGRHLIDELPADWVSRQLRTGRAVVLIDGVDELPDARREDARQWLRELMAAASGAIFVVTSRPGAAAADWLRAENFRAFSLQPMDTADIREFVKQWHESIARQIVDADEKQELLDYELTLTDQILTHQHLRRIAETPLLCALVCALNRERHGQLPAGRLELYEIAMEMLLERRDIESRVKVHDSLSRTQKTLILQDVAYWLVRNGWADVSEESMLDHIATKLSHMSKIDLDSRQVFAQLLERSGLIREPSFRRVDFVHKSFQEYLAAREVLAVDDIGLLIKNSHLDQWRDVVVMTAGLAHEKAARKLIESIISRGDSVGEHGETLYLVAMACLENCQEMMPEVRNMVQSRVSPLLPPKNLESARTLASSGDIAVELLLDSALEDETQISCSVRLAAEVSSELSFQLVKRYKMDSRPTILDELRRSWTRFDVDDYTSEIVKGSALDDQYLWIDQPDVIPTLGGLSKLLHLEAVCKLNNDDLSDVARLAQIRRLTVSPESICDLRILDESAIEAMEVRIDTCSDADLRRLMDISNLEELTILDCSGTGSLGPLQWFEHLRSLRLHNFDSQDVACLDILSNLKALAFVDAPDLLYLEQIETLNKPETVGLIACRHLRDISGISAWSASLRHLSLARSDIRSLAPLSNIEGLEVLDISHTVIEDIRPLVGLTSLKAINLAGCVESLDLSLIRHLPNLRFVVRQDGTMLSFDGNAVVDEVRSSSGDEAIQWRSCQKLIGVDFLPCIRADAESLLTDGSRWPDPLW